MNRLLVLAVAAMVGLLPTGAFGTTGPTWLGPDALTRIARDWLVEQFHDDVDPSALEISGPPRELLLPPGDVALNVTLQSGSVQRGTMTVLVEAMVTDGRGTRTSRTATVTFKINPVQEVVVAVRELPRRAVIGPADVRVERRAASRVPGGAVREPAQVVGKETTRAVAPGEVVTAQSLTAPLLIKRGSVVSLVLEGQNFKIVARGVAAEDGARGAAIRVVNQLSRREVVGRVEDERTVRVSF